MGGSDTSSGLGAAIAAAAVAAVGAAGPAVAEVVAVGFAAAVAGAPDDTALAVPLKLF